MKEICAPNHMCGPCLSAIFSSLARCASTTHDRKHADFALEHYGTYFFCYLYFIWILLSFICLIVTTFFRSPFGDLNTAVPTRQPVFVQLLQVAFRLSQCAWLGLYQRQNMEASIRTLADMAHSRSIAIPSDLDNQLTSLFNKPQLNSKSGKLFRSSRAQSQISRDSSQTQVIKISYHCKK